MKNHEDKINPPEIRSILEKFRYDILPGRFRPGFAATAKYNRTYAFWIEFWDEVMRDNGTHERIDAYEFLRSDLVAVISKEEEIVGVHLYSILNLEQINIGAHPYLNGEHEKAFIRGLLERNCKSAISHEYLTVAKNFRKSKIGFSFAPVVLGLGYQIQKALGIGASLGRCRQDVGVNKLFTEVGGITLKKDVMMYNTPTDFCALLLEDMRPHPDEATRDVIASLWNNRIDWSGQTHTEADHIKAA